MGKVTVRFEKDNFNKTLDFIKSDKFDEIEEEHKADISGYLRSEIEQLLVGEMEMWGTKDFRFFEHLCHHPIQGIACLYIVGDEPKESVEQFTVEIKDKGFQGNIVACLYTYLA